MGMYGKTDEAGDFKPQTSDESLIPLEEVALHHGRSRDFSPPSGSSIPSSSSSSLHTCDGIGLSTPRSKGINLALLEETNGLSWSNCHVSTTLTISNIRHIDCIIDFINCSFYIIVFNLQDIKEMSKYHSKTLPPLLGKQLVCFLVVCRVVRSC